MRGRSRTVLALIGVVSLSAANCAPGQQRRFGSAFPIPLSSPYQEEALDTLRGGHVAIAMFNEQGGLDGQTAQLLMPDDELNPAVAIDVTRDLITDQNVSFVTGGLSASVQLAIN
jgi:branched-chain amino acid transport system substrate-binding protein